MPTSKKIDFSHEQQNSIKSSHSNMPSFTATAPPKAPKKVVKKLKKKIVDFVNMVAVRS